MSWLIVTQDFPPFFTGGIASWATDLGAALTTSGSTVTVFARRTGNTTQEDATRPYAVRRMWGRSWNRYQGIWTLGAVWPHLGPGVRVLCATWRLATGLAGRLRGARLGVAVHGSDLSRLTAAPEALQRLIPHVEAFFPVSRFLGTHLRSLCPTIPPERIHVLPMPLVPPSLPDVPRRRELIVLSRLTPLKGIDRAISIATGLDRPLRIIGDGAARSALVPLAGPGVTFLGRQPRAEAMRLLCGASGLLLLPRTAPNGTGAEGLGLCLIEAAFRGVPGIGCSTGGVPEALGPGLLLPDPDRPDLDRIDAFLSDPSQGPRARSWAMRHHGPAHAVRVLREALP